MNDHPLEIILGPQAERAVAVVFGINHLSNIHWSLSNREHGYFLVSPTAQNALERAAAALQDHSCCVDLPKE